MYWTTNFSIFFAINGKLSTAQFYFPDCELR